MSEYERLNDIVFWYQLGRQAFKVGVKMGAIRVRPLSIAWESWRSGWLHQYDVNRGLYSDGDKS